MITQPGKMMVAAHRGDSYNCFENTMEAFRAAIASGADMIETDVHLSKDGVPVLIHDAKVDRTTDGTGFVAEKTYEELQQLNAGGGCRIPKLEELLELIASTPGMTLNLEMKVYYHVAGKEKCEECIDRCVELIEKYDLSQRMVFNSFDAYVLDCIDRKYGGKYMLHGFYPYDALHNVDRNPDEYLYCACIWGQHKPEHYQYLQERNIEPWIGASITQETRLMDYFKLGARLVTTNFPKDIIEKLERNGAR